MDILQVIELLRSKDVEIELHWVPAHSGIAGNEKADKAAKESTGWRLKKHGNNRVSEEVTNKTLPKFYISPLKAAIEAVHRRQIDIKWAVSWATESKERSSGLWLLPPAPRSYSYTRGLKSRKVRL